MDDNWDTEITGGSDSPDRAMGEDAPAQDATMGEGDAPVPSQAPSPEDAIAAPDSAADVDSGETLGTATAVESAGAADPAVGDTAEVPAQPAAKPAAKRGKVDPEPRVLSEEQMQFPWYVVHTYSGYEQRAKLTLEERVKTAGAHEKFGQIVVPHEKVVELVRGEKKTTSKKVFPGYILVQCILDDETWHIVKATPKITGFVGDSRNPVPLTKDEVDNLLKQMEGEGQRARPSIQFEQGDSVKVVDGPFADFNGTVDEVKPDKGKLRVLISIFGRNTPVELDFVQVEKV